MTLRASTGRGAPSTIGLVRSLGLALLLGLAALPASLGCGYGYYGSLGTSRKTTSSSASAWVAGGGTISSSRSVVGPYGAYPVSGVYVGPGGSGSYDYGTYGVSPYGGPTAPGAYYGPPPRTGRTRRARAPWPVVRAPP